MEFFKTSKVVEAEGSGIELWGNVHYHLLRYQKTGVFH